MSSRSSAPIRTVDCDINSHLVYIFPGGRWLLVAQRSGHVVLYDLNAPAASSVTVLREARGEDADLVEIMHIAVEVERSDPNFLSFKMVLCPNIQRIPKIVVYEVTLSPSPVPRKLSPATRLVCRLSGMTRGTPTSISIKGGTIAVGLTWRESNQSSDWAYVHVFNWREWDPPTIRPQLYFTVDTYNGPLIRASLVSESHMIVFTKTAASFYDLSLVTGIIGGHLPEWSVGAPFDIDGGGISQPSFCKDNVHLILRNGSSLYGFEFSRLDTRLGTFCNLLTSPSLQPENVLCLGHRRVFARTSDSDAVAIELNCDGVGPVQVSTKNGMKVPQSPLDTAIDEESGRVVVCTTGQLTIYDAVFPRRVM
ncbi:hypothetical protein BDN72DRAFT_848697 [Pluteus cervinus]|uniref:Uncharacterized protein n=1 Tax=Pluteus cervinus TaxID=181527 RepID=A0ACD3AAV0_9AGAR|nr:hypothetical protein BDN72DRAFT_848697 [Pluteus cervinus]